MIINTQDTNYFIGGMVSNTQDTNYSIGGMVISVLCVNYYSSVDYYSLRWK